MNYPLIERRRMSVIVKDEDSGQHGDQGCLGRNALYRPMLVQGEIKRLTDEVRPGYSR